MNENKKYSCSKLLEDKRQILQQDLAIDLPENFLELVYEYAIGKVFLRAQTIPVDQTLEPAIKEYLHLLRILSQEEKVAGGESFASKYPMNFLTEAEEAEVQSPGEYELFKMVFQKQYIYEIMKLNQEIGKHNTLDHICGVFYIAMYIARQLYSLGLPIDLGRMAGAAAAHDIGKYGCVGSEVSRAPYLHYYYTDVWFKENQMPFMGNVAVSHSTWDLELENLPVESLILIYADFRVKNKWEDNAKKMHIFTLHESFDVILNMLDNVDQEKENRYKRVYAKLKDFEEYMISKGVQTCLEEECNQVIKTMPVELLYGDEIVKQVKWQSIQKNIFLMNKLSTESSFHMIVDNAASERDWKRLRGYLTIFDEYYSYLAQGQKITTMSLLYRLLIHKEEDIRNQSAELIGKLIGNFDEEYRKEVPPTAEIEKPELTSVDLMQKYLSLFLYPDHKMIDAHREWIGLNTKTFLGTLFQYCGEQQGRGYIEVVFNELPKIRGKEEQVGLYMIQALKHIPFAKYPGISMEPLIAFISCAYDNETTEINLAILKCLYVILKELDVEDKNRKKIICEIQKKDKISPHMEVNYLRYKLLKELKFDSQFVVKYQAYYDYDKMDPSDIYLANLKSATSWLVKKANIDIVTDIAMGKNTASQLQTAMHLCNLLKVSSVESVRSHAGKALITIFSKLTQQERNEVCIELARALEMQDYQFTKYIPEYLGKMLLRLKPNELNENLSEFYHRIKAANIQITFLILRTVGYCIADYGQYEFAEQESSQEAEKRLEFMMGMLLNGIYNYDKEIKHEAFRILGKEIFGASKISLEERYHLFVLINKKLLNALSKIDDKELIFLNDAASLNNIYRFIADYEFFKGKMILKDNTDIAFFPGTFDPFSLGHKEIAREIRNLGFDVYLSVDEFSWSKRTQPNSMRREIIEMSISDEMNIYTFPEDLQINIANKEDLAHLREAFGNKVVFMVVGSDVVLNASSYKMEITKNSIHTFSHIIFERKNSYSSEKEEIQLKEALKQIQGKVIQLTLPAQYEDISSTQIRAYIDSNQDISQLIDPMAQKYIYEFGIYVKEPQYKTLLKVKSIDIKKITDPSEALLRQLVNQFLKGNILWLEQLIKLKEQGSLRLVVVKDMISDEIISFATYYGVRSYMYFNQFKDHTICEYVRNHTSGRVAVINGIYIQKNSRFASIAQITLTETLTFCLERDYTYAIYKNEFATSVDHAIIENLELQGFLKVPSQDGKNDIYMVNMTNPSTLNLDIQTMLKEPFYSNENIVNLIMENRKRLQIALTKLYPGQLMLSFDIDVLNEKLIDKVCHSNHVSVTPTNPRVLGEHMCVPFGSILHSAIVPNTVTKSLHTEKMYVPDLMEFTIESYPYYMNIHNQIKLLSSFNKEVILVDDLLHKGYRIKALDPLLKQQDIQVKKLIFGVMSGRGKEIMDIQNRQVDAVYFLPNLRTWFNEKSMYPFVGGDSVWRGTALKRYLLPSINFILPYAAPVFLRDSENADLFYLSQICIENAINLFKTIEREYQEINERNFTLKQLGEVFIEPRCPDIGKNVEYDLTLKPSEYLQNDLEKLIRIKTLI